MRTVVRSFHVAITVFFLACAHCCQQSSIGTKPSSTISRNAPFVTSGNKPIRKQVSCLIERAWTARRCRRATRMSRALPLQVLVSPASASQSERKWIDQAQALERTRNTLRFFDARAFHQRGWFYHWMDSKTGERRWNSEVSSIDTALLLAGVLTVRQCFREDQEIVRLADRIYRRVDFRWMLNGDPRLLSHGWKPETGFLRPRWDTYSEDTILYLLAIGSPTYPISPASWHALWRDRYRYEGHSYFTTIGVPLVHAPVLACVDRLSQQARNNGRSHRLFSKLSCGHARSSRFLHQPQARLPCILDQTSGVSPPLTARKAISRGVVHHAILTSMEPSCLLPPVVR